MNYKWKSKEQIQQEFKSANKEIEKQKAMNRAVELSAVQMAKNLPTEQLIEIKALFPEWSDLIGKSITKAEYPYIQHGDGLYLLNQDTLIQAHFEPGAVGMDSIFSKVAIPGTIAEWVQPTGAHDIYNKYGSGKPKSDPVKHNGKTWISTIDNNDTEPGTLIEFGFWVEKI